MKQYKLRERSRHVGVGDRGLDSENDEGFQPPTRRPSKAKDHRSSFYDGVWLYCMVSLPPPRDYTLSIVIASKCCLRSHRTAKLKNFPGGACTQTPLVIAWYMYQHHSAFPPLKKNPVLIPDCVHNFVCHIF